MILNIEQREEYNKVTSTIVRVLNNNNINYVIKDLSKTHKIRYLIRLTKKLHMFIDYDYKFSVVRTRFVIVEDIGSRTRMIVDKLSVCELKLSNCNLYTLEASINNLLQEYIQRCKNIK